MVFTIKSKIVGFILVVSVIVGIATGIFVEGFLKNGPNNLPVQPLYFFLSLFALILISTIVFSFSLLKPIDELIIATQVISGGRYGHKVRERSKDEFGRLAKAFNTMSNKLRVTMVQRARYSKLAAEEKSKTDLIIDSMTDGVIVTNADYKIVLFNHSAEKLFGFSEDKVIDQHIIHFLEKFNMSEVINQYPAIDKDAILPVREVNVVSLEVEVEKPKNMILKATIAPVKNEKNIITGAVMVLEDITRMKEIDRMKSDFVSTVSHELRTPLTSILGYTSILISGKLGEIQEKQLKSLMIVDKESKRLAALIEDILDLSRIESGKTKINFEETDIVELLKGTNVINLPKRKQIKFSIVSPKKMPNVMIDRNKISQVFTNLISNSVKFTKEKGKITVKFTDTKEHIRIDVIDTGVGIKKDNLHKIFKRFYQIDSHLTRTQSGTGLGLSIVKEIVGLHCGLLSISSKYNKGTTISFTIPKRRISDNLQKFNCWEKMNCEKMKCPAYKVDNNRCWLEMGTLCKKSSKEPCYDKISICNYCDLYKECFVEEVIKDEQKENTDS